MLGRTPASVQWRFFQCPYRIRYPCGSGNPDGDLPNAYTGSENPDHWIHENLLFASLILNTPPFDSVLPNGAVMLVFGKNRWYKYLPV